MAQYRHGWLRRYMRLELAGSLHSAAESAGTNQGGAETEWTRFGGAGLAVSTLRRVLQHRRPSTWRTDANPGTNYRGTSEQHDETRLDSTGLPHRLMDSWTILVWRGLGTYLLPPEWHDICTQIEWLVFFLFLHFDRTLSVFCVGVVTSSHSHPIFPATSQFPR